MNRLIFVVVCSFVIFSGCSTQHLEDQIRKLDRSLSDSRKFQTEQNETIVSLDSQLKAVSGRLEELEYAQNKKLGSALSRLDQDVNSLRKRIPPPSLVPVEELEVDQVWGENLSGEPKELFEAGLQHLRDGRFNEALSSLENAVSQLEGSDRPATPLFWVGVSYEGIDDLKSALRAYVELASRYPKSQRAPSAFLRQAKLLARLGDAKAAELALKKLVTDYPRSQEVSAARQMQRDLSDRN